MKKSRWLNLLASMGISTKVLMVLAKSLRIMLAWRLLEVIKERKVVL